jgi:hypothetical protein
MYPYIANISLETETIGGIISKDIDNADYLNCFNSMKQGLTYLKFLILNPERA